jgi:hypothetical protein
MIGLVAPHGIFTRLIPCAGRFSIQIVLADQCLLDRPGPFGINLLLAAYTVA